MKEKKEVIYYTGKNALLELKRRQKTDIKEKMEDWWKEQKWEKPNFLPPNGDHVAILARQVATARVESIIFHRKASEAGLRPLLIEDHDDMFSRGNSYKKGLIHLPVKRKNDITVLKIGSRKHAEGKKLADIPLLENHVNGSNRVVDYHRHLAKKVFGNIEIHNASDWYRSFGTAQDYYLPLLSLFVGHAIMFENFHGKSYEDESEREFDEIVFGPAYDRIIEVFGLHPIIVHLPWREEMKYYPGQYLLPKTDNRSHLYTPRLLKLLN
ncbi:MAG: hypothetical protein WA063_05725 [Minisyncoccia bacterium]